MNSRMLGVVSNVVSRTTASKDRGGYFFVRGDDGQDYFAHARDLEDARGQTDPQGLFQAILWRHLRNLKTRVEFEPSQHPKPGKGNGLNATHVRITR